ncbi:DUF2231 domain-containing protein [Ilumatobacter sp.]|uniref:DUF2231 domain-containing protein n=1 Tax=Ilumatobacter sp. TaxID=1967498 RepID=UPI003B51F873
MLAGLLDSLFGIPTHAFAIHAPVVLVPLGSVVAVALAVRADWRHRVGWWLAPGVAVLVGLLWFAKESGEALRSSGNVLGDVEEHTELAEATFVMSLVWLAAAVALVVGDRRLRSSSGAGVATAPRDALTVTLAVVFALLAAVTTVWLVRTGHAGSRSRWVG